jgi:hypothetical protein
MPIKYLITDINDINFNKKIDKVIFIDQYIESLYLNRHFCKFRYTTFYRIKDLNKINYNSRLLHKKIHFYRKQLSKVLNTIHNTNLSESDHIYFEKENNTLNFTFRTAAPKNCGLCQSLLTLNVQFINSPNFLFIESLLNNIYISDFPETVFLDNKIFKLLCVTIVRGNHFTAIFKLNNKYYLVDDLGRLFKEIDTSIPKRGQAAFYPSTCSLYYLE